MYFFTFEKIKPIIAFVAFEIHLLFLAALAALYPPWSLTYWLTDWPMVMDLEPSRPNQTKPTWPNLPIHLSYPPTWFTNPTMNFQNFDKTFRLWTGISNFLPDFTILAYLHNFGITSQFQNFNQISKFGPNFGILTKF